MPAQLLVSVRSPQEAAAALDGGADIIDIKEPRRGSLGRCDDSVIADIVRLVRHRSPNVLVSAALGEVRAAADYHLAASDVIGQLDLVKSGLSGLQSEPVNWCTAWLHFRQQIMPTIRPATQWVAVSYADADRSGSPAPLEVLEEARQAQCPVLLVDTFDKDGTTLFDWLSSADLAQLRRQTDRYRIKLALAGRISAALLPQVLAVNPDIVAVRGAACEQGERTATVSADRVRELAESMTQSSTLTALPGE